MNQEKIGKFIATTRKVKKLTQEELAEKLGVSSKSISRWENGKCMPDLALLVPLSKELELNVNDLLAGEIIDKADLEKTTQINIGNLVNKVNEDNKKSRFKRLYITLIIVFVIMPLLILSIGEFKVSMFPSFSSFKIIHRANQFYEALKANDLKLVDDLITDDVHNEMCWMDDELNYGTSHTKANFLNNLDNLHKFKYKVEYTSFKAKYFRYVDYTVGGWDYEIASDDSDATPIISCSWPSRNGFMIDYELCFKDRVSRACIMLTFQLDDEDRLVFMVGSSNPNLRDEKAYKKYYPIWFPASENNASYNKLHILVEYSFRGEPFESVVEGMKSYGENS